jgi:hypothetical protein
MYTTLTTVVFTTNNAYLSRGLKNKNKIAPGVGVHVPVYYLYMCLIALLARQRERNIS